MNDHSRNRPEEDMRQIELHQNLGRAATEILAENLGASFILIDNSIDNERQTVVTLHEGLTA
jgi:adenylate kinase